MDDSTYREEADSRLTLSDLLPIISDLNMSPHAVLAAARRVATLSVRKEEALEIVWLATRLVQSKGGGPDDLERFVEELHRLSEGKVCDCYEILHSLRELCEGVETRYGFQMNK